MRADILFNFSKRRQENLPFLFKYLSHFFSKTSSSRKSNKISVSLLFIMKFCSVVSGKASITNYFKVCKCMYSDIGSRAWPVDFLNKEEIMEYISVAKDARLNRLSFLLYENIYLFERLYEKAFTKTTDCMAKELSVSRRAIFMAIRRLIDAGYITRETNKYGKRYLRRVDFNVNVP